MIRTIKKLSLVCFVLLSFVTLCSAKTVLITGFEPFGGEKVNPSWEAVRSLPDTIDEAKVVKVELPVTFKGASQKLDKMVNKYDPDVIIGVGEAGGRDTVSIERVAINIDDARIPDNDGYKPESKAISADGQIAYFSKLPIDKITTAIKSQGIPANISNTAGTYVCNHIMYHILESINEKYPNKKGGFIHLPYSPEQTVDKKNTPSMNTVDATKALEQAIKVTLIS